MKYFCEMFLFIDRIIMKQKVIPIIADDNCNYRKENLTGCNFSRESSFNYSNRRSRRGSYGNNQYYEDNIEEEPELT